MPKKTIHYDLTMFGSGDVYLSSLDKRRFSIIDNQFDFLATQIGDGIIMGWGITSQGGTTVRVAEGLGISEEFVTETFGFHDITLQDNLTHYLYARRKVNVTGDRSSFCPYVSVSYTDSTPPAAPATPAVTSHTFNSITLHWTANTEPDFDHYDIYRSPDNVTFTLLDSVSGTTYTDTDVTENTVYYYKLKSFDVNGLTGGFGGTLSASTDIDTRLPADVTNLETIASDEMIEILWDASVYLVDHYHVVIQPIDTEGQNDGAPTTVNTTQTYLIVNDLVNDQPYRVTVYTISSNGTSSGGVNTTVTPQVTFGLKDVTGFVVSDIAVDSSYNVAVSLSWTLDVNSYQADPAYYLLSIDDGSGTVTPTVILTDNVTLVQYTLGDVTKNLHENTHYVFTVQTVNADGVASAGFKLRYKTHKFSPPGPVSNLTVSATYTPTTKSVTANWTNTNTEFAYNLLTVTKTPLGSSSSSAVYIENAKPYAKSQSYSVPKSEIENQQLYTVKLIAVDSSGNQSDAVISTVVINEVFDTTAVTGGVNITGSRPDAPTFVSAISGDSQVTIYWSAVESDNIISYRVWRAPFTASISASSDFTMVAEVPAGTLKFNDYTVTNGDKYSYIVTSYDVFGEESPGPRDGFMDYVLAIGEPHAISTITPPPVISAVASGNSVELTWQPDTGDFDGYEIWRSVGTTYNWEKIGTTDPFAISYEDTNGLQLSGSYYYMIRKYREGAEIIDTTSALAPLGAVLLGKVVVSNGNILSIDSSQVENLLGMRSPILTEALKQFRNHIHVYNSESDDRRIRLGDNLFVGKWTTTDFTTYTTTQDIRGTGDYIAYINGLESTFNSFVDRDTRTLSFESAIFDSSVDPNATEPVVTVIFLNTSEVQGILPEENIGPIIANKINKGKLGPESLTQIDHLGRYHEPGIPSTVTATRQNAFTFQVTMPTGVTFYDLLITSDGRMVAGTSEGVRVTASNDSTQWTVTLANSLPVTKLHYSNTYQWYFALAVNQVFYSSDLTTWKPISGITGAGFLQDITEDTHGNLYVSADSGIYSLNPGNSTKLYWTQAATVDTFNNATYALYYDSSADHVYVSANSGIYYTADQGATWLKFSSNEVNTPVFTILQSLGYTFLVSNNKIWRKYGSAKFTSIADFPFPIRKAVIFNDELYVTTDQGLFRSVPTDDIYADSNVGFVVAFLNLQKNGIMPAVLALRVINSRLYMGMDEWVYSAPISRKLSLHSDVHGICPTIFVNGIVRNVGAYYNKANVVVFDTPTAPTDVVTAVNQYTQFNLVNGGWVVQKYDAAVELVINGVEQLPPPIEQFDDTRPFFLPPNPVTSPTDATTLDAMTQQIVTPFFNARNSNFDDAFAALTTIVQTQASIGDAAIVDPATVISPSTITKLFTAVNVFKMNVTPELAAQVKTPPIGTSVTTASGITYSFDCVAGTITISGGVDKYTQVAFNIADVSITGTGTYTHKEIEDAIEKINSGLPASLASVQQSNLVKVGIYNQVIDPGGQVAHNLVYQAKFNAGCDRWYDKLNSTVDYVLQLEQPPTVEELNGGDVQTGSFSINYPADILYIPANTDCSPATNAQVWVCGEGGIIAVDATTYVCSKIFQSPFYFYNMSLSGGTVYALAEDGLYTIDVCTREVTKNVDFSLPDNYTSVIQFGDTTFIATKTGLVSRRPFELTWTPVLTVNNSFVRQSTQLSFCIGQDPNDATTSVVFYSFQGVVWNRSTQFEGVLISAATQRFDTVYYASNQGLLVEDLSTLFSSGTSAELGTTSQNGVVPVDLNGDDSPDYVAINSVDSDATRVLAVTPDGMWYELAGNTVTNSGASRLDTIHKVKVIAGKGWFFADNLIDIEGVDRVITLSTGKAL